VVWRAGLAVSNHSTPTPQFPLLPLLMDGVSDIDTFNAGSFLVKISVA